jgi:hypothetical protein
VPIRQIQMSHSPVQVYEIFPQIFFYYTVARFVAFIRAPQGIGVCLNSGEGLWLKSQGYIADLGPGEQSFPLFFSGPAS